MAKTRILLIGAGAIGTMTALNLEASGECEVTAVLRSNYQIVMDRGFEISSLDHGVVKGWRMGVVRNTIPDVSKESLPPYDYVLLTTKNTPDMPPSPTDLIRPAVTPGHTTIILIQNGLNIHLPFLAAFPQNTILSGISRMGANETAPGVILQDDPDRLSVGVWWNKYLDQQTELARAERFVELYAKAGKAEVVLDNEVQRARWRKLLYNASWNPVCALAGLDTGRFRLVGVEDAEKGLSPVELLLKPAMREVFQVARADGVEIVDADQEEEVIESVTQAEPVDVWCQPSMLQDANKGRVWEIENLVGDVVRVARERAVEVPVLSVLYALGRARMWRLKEEWGVVKREDELVRWRERSGV